MTPLVEGPEMQVGPNVTVTWTVPTDRSLNVSYDQHPLPIRGLLRFILDSLRDLLRHFDALAYGYGPFARRLGRFRLGFTLGLVGAFLWPALVVQWALLRKGAR